MSGEGKEARLTLYGATQTFEREKPRRRVVGNGTPFSFCHRDPLLIVLWLRRHPTHETLSYCFGVSAITFGRVITRVLPLLDRPNHPNKIPP